MAWGPTVFRTLDTIIKPQNATWDRVDVILAEDWVLEKMRYLRITMDVPPKLPPVNSELDGTLTRQPVIYGIREVEIWSMGMQNTGNYCSC